MKKKLNRFEEVKMIKQSADNTWSYIYKDALNGNIDRVSLVNAINTCNIVDKEFYKLKEIYEKL